MSSETFKKIRGHLAVWQIFTIYYTNV